MQILNLLKMQSLAASTPAPSLSFPPPPPPPRSKWSANSFKSITNSSLFPARGIYTTSKLLEIPPLAASRRKPIRRVAALFEGEGSSVSTIESTETTTDETAVISGPSSPVKFILQKDCHFGQRFNVVGDDLLFGNWDPLAGVSMKWSEGHIWTAELDVPLGKKVEFKFVLTGNDGEVEWQPGQNRIFETTESISPLVVSEPWELAESEDSSEDKVPEVSTEQIVAEAVDAAEDAVGVLIAGMSDDVKDPEGDKGSTEEVSEFDFQIGEGNGQFPVSGLSAKGELETAPEITSFPEVTLVTSTLEATAEGGF